VVETKPPRDPAGDSDPFAAALRSVDRALLAYSTLHDVAADPLEPELEQRLQALLVNRVTPLLLRCLQTWEGGAQRLLSYADALFWPAGGALAGVCCCQARACHWASWLLPLSCAAGMPKNACRRGSVPWCPLLRRTGATR